MRYGSVCSGIEAASLAWEPLGWQAAWLAEIEPFPSKVLAARWAAVPNLGDMCNLPLLIRQGFVEAPDVLVGGTPCQAYSVAGKREGLADARGQLTLKFVEVADAIDSQRPGSPCVVVWENVPGVLSSRDNAFGCFLGDLVGEDCTLEPPGGKWSNCGVVHGPTRTAAWRVLDAQYFGVAQRRRRVFVVASARAGFHPAAVLFEFEGVRRDSAPRREAGETVTGTLASRVGAGGFPGSDEAMDGCVVPVIMAHGQAGAEIRSDGEPSLTCNHEAPIVCQYGNVAGSLTARHDSSPCADRGMNVVAQGYDILGTPASEVAKETDVHTPLRARVPGQFENSTVTVVAVPHTDTMPTMRAGASANGGPGHGARSGDSKDEYITPVLAYSIRSDAMREGVALTPSPDAEGRVRLRNPGMGVYEEISPTVDCGVAHAVAFAQNTRDEVRYINGDGSIAGALAAEPGMKQQTYIAFHPTQDPISSTDGSTHAVGCGSSHGQASVAVAFAFEPGIAKRDGSDNRFVEECCPTLRRQMGDNQPAVAHGLTVRRLMPIECERLQGMPDNHTLIAPNTPDGPRYKSIGNSKAVPVVKWLGERIAGGIK